MSVLIDTTIWSLALRRQPSSLRIEDQILILEWRRLVSQGEARLAGPVRQELLSGIRDPGAFRTVQAWLEFFEYVEIELHDYDQAAVFSNTLQSHGIASSAVDVLLCALAYRWQFELFTVDADFRAYAVHLPIQLHRLPRS